MLISKLPGRTRALLFLCFFYAGTGVASACDQIPAGEHLWVRLAAPVSTYTAKPGDPVHAILTQDIVCEADVVLPMGTEIGGIVQSKRKVGLGLRHETAALELVFNHAATKSGDEIYFTARVEEVENAREGVKKGVIEGIRSSDTFQGRINSRLIHLPTLNPYSDPVLVVYKAVFPIFPEPEIYYPAGTDLRLRMTGTTALTAAVENQTHEFAQPAQTVTQDQARQLVEQLPWQVTTKKNVSADLINLVFLGSEDEVRTAFRIAQWQGADPVSKRAALKNFYALLNNSGYSNQPMMTFLLDGRPQDMSLQKSLNSYGRRDHLRIWKWPAEENDRNGQVWVSSSTHDMSAVLAVKYKGFVHHINPEIDEERATVIRDLNFAGCVKSVNYVSRPEMPASNHNATGDTMHTDGSIAVVALQACHPVQTYPDANNASYKPGNHVFRFFRRQILTLRNDILRANVIYAAYDGGRMTWNAFHHPGKQVKEEKPLPVTETHSVALVAMAPVDHTDLEW